MPSLVFGVCYWVFPIGVGCGVEQGCCVMKRPPVSCERWCAAGCAADWPEVHSELLWLQLVQLWGWVLLAGCSDERLCVRSTRHRGRAVLGHFFHLIIPFLDVLSTVTLFGMMICWSEWPPFILVAYCPAWSAIGWLKSCGRGQKGLFC